MICKSPFKYFTTSDSVETGTLLMPSTTAASASLAFGRINCSNSCSRVATATGRIPRTGRTSPSSDNSPTTIARLRFSGGNSPIVPSKARAIGKSKPEPILRKEAGARFTTTLRTGKLYPELLTADRIRSRLSLIVLSGNPTILKTLIPTETSTSTSIK